MKNISTLLNISLIVLSLIIISCDDDYEPYVDSEEIDCEYCFETMPQYVDMELQFNQVQNSETVYFTVYSGYAFASSVYMRGGTDQNSLWIEVLPDQKYTVVAEYERAGRFIHVINDCLVKTEYFKYGCDEPCYYVYEAHCDLKLKNVTFD
ncbi:MAG TPA: hypothetical protein PKN32_11765 [Bacteroidales bacterium]|nr:hypothetical protein [Bacteroidales bacterium]